MFPKEVKRLILQSDKIDMFCVGSPSAIGDLVGPLTGTRLKILGLPNINIVGTVRDPVVRSNYNEKKTLLRTDALVIVVDAALGRNVGGFNIGIGAMSPGSGTDKGGVEPVGDIFIKCYTADKLNGVFIRDARMVNYQVTKLVSALLDLIKFQK